MASLKVESVVRVLEDNRERGAKWSHVVAIADLDPRVEEVRVEPREETQVIPLMGEDKTTRISTSLSKEDTTHITQILQKNVSVFAWTATDMSGVNQSIIMHRLSTFKDAKPVSQKKRKLGEEKRVVTKEKAKKLLQAGFIREAHYTTWLGNMVLVRKPSEKWRMCTNYTDLNKAIPKDAYPLPSIDRLVDGASGHKFMSFLDAFSGYNQISMHPYIG